MCCMIFSKNVIKWNIMGKIFEEVVFGVKENRSILWLFRFDLRSEVI